MSGKKRSPYSNEQNYPLLLKKKAFSCIFLKKKNGKNMFNKANCNETFEDKNFGRRED